MPEVLDEKQLRQLADRIATSVDQLGQEIAHLEILTQPVPPDAAIGRLSRLEALNELAVNEQALASARSRQLRLRAALGNLHESEFGLCSHCAEPIPFARLLSIPETKLCVACAEQVEN